MKNIYKILFFTLVGVILVSGSFFMGQEYQKRTTTPVLSISPSPAITPELTDAVVPSVEATPEAQVETEVQAKAAIQAAMAAKYNKAVNDVDITISKYQSGYAQGGVQFAGEMGGGWMLAAKVNNEWVIVADGNGTISCEKIDSYNFPVSMVAECWSETTQELVTRQ